MIPIHRIGDALDTVSGRIKKAEEDMREAGWFFDIEAIGGVSWERHEGRMRLILSGKPLMEAPVRERLDAYMFLRPLIEAGNKLAVEREQAIAAMLAAEEREVLG